MDYYYYTLLNKKIDDLRFYSDFLSSSEIRGRIEAIRETLGISKSRFAETLEVSSPYYCQISNGQVQVSDRIIRNVCRVYSISPDWLRNGVEPYFLETHEYNKLFNGKDDYERTEIRKAIIYKLDLLDTDSLDLLNRLADKMVP